MAMVEELLELEDTPGEVVNSRPSPVRFTLKVASVALENSADTPAQTTGLNPIRHGNWAQWAAVCVAILIGLINTGLLLGFRHADNATKTSDEHVNGLITGKLDPAVKGINDHMDGKFDSMSKQLADMTGKIGNVEGQLEVLRSRQAKQEQEQKQLGDRVGQQEALNRIQDPNLILGIIRTDIKLAQDGQTTLSPSQLADFKAALRVLPSSAREYWITAADIINYQSLVNQLGGFAPDPRTLAKSCITGGPGIVSRSNIFSGTFQNCIVDLDTQVFQDATFQNSVIRYRGGPVSLTNVRFINCWVALNLPAGPVTPTQQKLLLALLNSPDQKTVQVEAR